MEKISKVDSLLANKLPTVATTSGRVGEYNIDNSRVDLTHLRVDLTEGSIWHN
jgi:hypothetical protein